MGVTLRFSANEGTLKVYLSQFDAEKLEMASMMGICGSLVGPKSENVEKPFVFVCFFQGQKGEEDSREELQPACPDRPGGGRGRVNPPPRRLVWRFWEVWRVLVHSIYTPRGTRPRRIILASNPNS